MRLSLTCRFSRAPTTALFCSASSKSSLPLNATATLSPVLLRQMAAVEEEREALEMERARLMSELAACDHRRAVDIDWILAEIDRQLRVFAHREYRELESHRAMRERTVQYVDEFGEQREWSGTLEQFRSWMTDVGFLKDVADGESGKEIADFDKISETATYCLGRRPFHVAESTLERKPEHRLDTAIIRALQQRLVDAREFGFGAACEKFLAEEPKYRGFTVIKTASANPAANPYAFRFNDRIEVDFYATNGTEAIAGMYQVAFPTNTKIGKFIGNCAKLNPPATKRFFGVAFAQPADLDRLCALFDAVFVRNGETFGRHEPAPAGKTQTTTIQ